MADWHTSSWGEDSGAELHYVPDEEPPLRGLGMKRAVAGGVAGVALLVGPVGLATAVVPTEDVDIETSEDANALFASMDRNSAASAELSQVQVNEALAVQDVPDDTTDDGKAGAPTAEVTTTTTSTTTTTVADDDDEGSSEPPSEGDHDPDTGAGVGDPGDYATWDALAQCESGGDWSINTGNGYYGGIQFSLPTWQSVGGTGLPSDHSREEQIHRGQILQSRAGWGQWPACTASLGYR